MVDIFLEVPGKVPEFNDKIDNNNNENKSDNNDNNGLRALPLTSDVHKKYIKSRTQRNPQKFLL